MHILKMHTCAYLVLHICALMHVFFFSYSSIFLLPRPISLINIQTASGVRRERSFFRLLSLLLFLCFNRPLTPLKVPKVDELVLGKVVASEFGQWKVPLQQQGEPGFLMPLVLHVLAKSLFCLVLVMMRNVPESAHFAQELRILLLVQRRGASLIQG